ncbi:spermidine/putrescine import ATP-binding protein PotA 1 [Acetobacter syzygii]|uniref:ABC transporter ATP-binding protein n=1 Tax=Acetobacter syzygii TaxID=146476 RepID=UPI0005DFBC9C|nr:ABC transporter ATP-binding protein [Acetobacter syzygii]GAN71881.1 ABC transporter spermidine/putrescine permease [Acetobacter syzygii]GBR65267.1 spermidine/putrescine transporter ATP-binding protein [Acetobacter syzygii NRIC 0483]GEL55226.1 spermidine/putrescine import ATP-binding protein PotA 1 [Acetobacter syzygii]
MPPAHGSPPALTLTDFTVLPGARPLALRLATGQCIALLGIGSTPQDLTTLTEILAGRQQSMGQINICGTDVGSRPQGKRGIATIGPHAPLFAHLCVTDNILFPLRVAGTLPTAEINRRLTEVLALMGLDAVRTALPRTLTAEQAFRVALARALVTSPDLLVLNQPFADMPPQAVKRSLAFLERLRQAIGLTSLFLTRDRTEAFMAANTIGVMDNGHLLQLADAPTLLNRPATPAVAQALGEANILTGKVLRIDDDVAELRLPSGETVEAMADMDLQEHDLASICILPDRLSVLFPRQGEPDNMAEAGDLPCTLVSAHHLGHTIIMRMRLRDGMEVTVNRPPVHTQRELNAGRPALLAWQTRNATAFPMDKKTS